MRKTAYAEGVAAAKGATSAVAGEIGALGTSAALAVERGDTCARWGGEEGTEGQGSEGGGEGERRHSSSGACVDGLAGI